MKTLTSSHATRVSASAFSLALLLIIGFCFVSPAFADGDATDEYVQGSAITDEELAASLAASGLDPAGDEYTGYEALYLDDLSEVDGLDGTTEGDAELDASKRVHVVNYAGANRYETSAKEALGGWKKSDLAIITTGENWVDALAISGLAGALDCPVLLTQSTTLPESISGALNTLGVSRVIIVGGKSAVTSAVESEMQALGISVETRLAGDNRFGTQLAIYEYGASNSLWDMNSYAVLASGAEGGFADALSIASLAFAQKMPVFIVDGDGALSAAQKKAFEAGISDGTILEALIAGGPVRISEATENYARGALYGPVTRLAGDNRYQTSVQIAQWAVSNGYLTWNKAAFTTGAVPYDALGGGALQGRIGAVMLLIDDGWATEAANAVRDRDVSAISFFGGTSAIGQQARSEVMVAVGGSLVIRTAYDLTLSRAAAIEADASPYDDKKAFLEKMNPDSFDSGSASYLQFAVISGYTGAISVEQMDAYIEKMVVYNEANLGVKSTMRGQAAAIIGAAKKYDINEFYFLAHSALESGWGCSALSQGSVENYKGYYNFFGIGAYDTDPLNGGAAMAKKEGWNTVPKAFEGAAKWISDNYISGTLYPDSGPQNTLYKMRYDLKRMSDTGNCWHQYATSITWPATCARVMSEIYAYAGYSIADAGIVFDVPLFLS